MIEIKRTVVRNPTYKLTIAIWLVGRILLNRNRETGHAEAVCAIIDIDIPALFDAAKQITIDVGAYAV